MCRSISHYLNMKYLGSVIVMGTDAVFNAYSMQPTIISAIYWRLKEYAVQRLHKRPTFISITRIRIGIQRNSVYWKQLSWLNELGERGGGENKRFSIKLCLRIRYSECCLVGGNDKIDWYQCLAINRSAFSTILGRNSSTCKWSICATFIEHSSVAVYAIESVWCV